MPLSEHEQRLLEQIERSLLDEDPKFASAVRATDPRHHAVRRVVWAVALFVLGVAVMVVGLVTKFTPGGVPILGIVGFVVMFGAAVLAVRAYRHSGRHELRVVGGDGPGRTRRPRSSLVDRLEQRWRRRHDERY